MDRPPGQQAVPVGRQPPPRGRLPRHLRRADPPARVAAILRHIAFDVEEPARARRVEELQAAKAADDPRAERSRRPAEPDLNYAEYCDRTTTPWRSTQQGDLAWTAYQAERRRRGETDEDPFAAYHPFRQGHH
ncbi:hypothetical protein [Streptomyces incanus]|uniref:Uncharacterized protein n=1 Tax=Streptomyces incanus TaxID=887453 RepID=A0ABW0Y1X3_9ACTN